jgi:hypothetical protein
MCQDKATSIIHVLINYSDQYEDIYCCNDCWGLYHNFFILSGDEMDFYYNGGIHVRSQLKQTCGTIVKKYKTKGQ